jgi:hypothetical protein
MVSLEQAAVAELFAKVKIGVANGVTFIVWVP